MPIKDILLSVPFVAGATSTFLPNGDYNDNTRRDIAILLVAAYCILVFIGGKVDFLQTILALVMGWYFGQKEAKLNA